MQKICKNSFSITIREQEFLLLKERAIYWPKEKLLILADLHIGKVGHFRKAGIPIPQKSGIADLLALKSILDKFEITSCYFLGDLFHSERNREWDGIDKLMALSNNINFYLIPGNHDQTKNSFFNNSKLMLLEEKVSVGPFCFTHYPIEEKDTNLEFVICGHLHPGVRLKGLAYQSLRLPCFYLQSNQLILPAFSKFTGKYLVKQKKGERIIAIAEDELFEV